MSKIDQDRGSVSAEIEAVREEALFDIAKREHGDFYQEILIEGNPVGDCDPVAFLGIFPVVSKGRVTLDLVDIFRGDAPEDELGYFRHVQKLDLSGCSFKNDPIVKISDSVSTDLQTSLAMRELALRNAPSAMLVFISENSSAHLFHSVLLTPSEALSQLKDTAATGIEQQS
jgi:hypothetical protein